MLQQLAFHTQQITKATSTQDLDPRLLANNDHPSVLPFEMYAIEPGEPPSRSLCWKPLGFLNHIMRCTNRDRFPLSLWEVWFCSTIGVPIPALIGPSQQCACNKFQHDFFGDHLQTCKVKSSASQVHDWVVYLQVEYMMILVVYYSCMITVKLRLLPTKYRRNRVYFASSVWVAMLTLKGQWG
jgi:hypothetical protein